MHCFHDTAKAVTLNLSPQQLITPVSSCRNRIKFQLFELNADGINLKVKIAQIINETYLLFVGFVVIHDKQTMAYTASALSFMLENLTKTVVLHDSCLTPFAS
jgi:lysophospholipase